VLAEAFGRKDHPDQQQKAQRQHFRCRLTLNEPGDPVRRQQHPRDGGDDRRDHDRSGTHAA